MQRELPPVLIFGAAVICGTFAALAAHILLRGAGVELLAMWRDIALTNAAETKAALAWWLTAGTALVASWIVVVTLTSQPIHRGPLLQWLLAGLLLGALAGIGHTTAGPAGIASVHKVAGSFLALGLGALMAFCATHFAMRR
jgi:hypothetical protein